MTCSVCPLTKSQPLWDASPDAARQLASRARRRVQGGARIPDDDRSQQRVVVDAFLAALRGGDVEGLLAVLDPSRRGPRRRGWGTSWRTEGDPRGAELGEGGGRFLTVCPVCATGARRRWRGTCLCSRRTPLPGAPVHDRAREDL